MAAKEPKEVAKIYDSTTVKFFVLYVVKSLGGHATKAAIDEVVVITENVSYFDYSDALASLISTEHITTVTLQEQTYYVITSLGTEALVHFTGRIPSWARGRIGKAVLEYRARIKYESEIRHETEVLEDGSALVTLSIHDLSEGDRLMFSTTLRMPGRADADLLGRAFRKDPTPLYSTVVRALSQLMDELNREDHA